MTGARPSVGSSRIRSFGFIISARAMVSICCSPPDSVPAACFWRVAQDREQVEQPADLLGALGRRQMLAAEIEIFAHRHVGEQFAAFGALHDAVARDRRRGPAAQRGAFATDVARIGQQAGDGIEQRGLAGAVQADDRDEFAGMDMDRHVLERLRLAVDGR